MSDNTNTSAVEAWKWQESWPQDGGDNMILTKVALEKPDPKMLYVLPETIRPLASLQTKEPVEDWLVERLETPTAMLADYLDKVVREMQSKNERRTTISVEVLRRILTRLRTDRAMVLEEAAKVAESWMQSGELSTQSTAWSIAQSIRALASKENR